MKRSHIFVAVLGSAFLILCGGALTSADAPKGQLRVGTFDRTALLIAYYKSAANESHLASMQKSRDEAKAAGNQELAKKIDEEGGALQELAHKQLVGQAELTNIYEHLKPALRGIGEKANVAVIVEKPWFNDESVELVDITSELVGQLKPAEKSRG